MNGRVVGHYRVLEKIGVGGMGEVFRAHDERLGRDVALKILRLSAHGNADHQRRFEQEARAAAALNHPNIVAIYDVGVERESPYIVCELLEGETLRQRLLRGALPIAQACDYALQICRGLAAAHERRIIHRDLKPENLFVTQNGTIKILDFGVAKLQTPAESSGDVESMVTITKTGSVIGTVAYMSPEQVRGKGVDHRTDIFSLGAILYEMLTGKRAFKGDTEADTITALLREEISETNFDQAAVPPVLQGIVRHCLEKEAANRFQTAKDLAFALETLSSPAEKRAFRVSKSYKTALKALAAGLGTALAVLLGISLFRPNAQPPEYKRLTYEQGTVYSARFAPDGSIVYTAAWNAKPLKLFSTIGQSLLAQALNFKDSNLLAISPSNELALLEGGSHIAHLETDEGMLARAPLAGGSPKEVLADVHWADFDSIGDLAVVHRYQGQSRLEYPIGHVLYQTSGWISHIRFSPDGKLIAFMDHPALWDDRGVVSITDLAGHVRSLSPEWQSEDGLAWRPDGKEIWFAAIPKGNDRDIYAVDLSGKVRNVIALPGSVDLLDISPNGRVLVTLNTQRMALAFENREGKNIDLSWHDWNIAHDISPDGQNVLFEDSSEIAGPHYAVAMRNVDGELPVRLGEGSAGSFSPDGKWAISILPGTAEITLLPVGAGQPRTVVARGLEKILNGMVHFLPDGKSIMVNGNEPGHAVRCYLVDLEDGKIKAISPEGRPGGFISPDAKLLSGTSLNRSVVYSIPDGVAHPIPGVTSDISLVRWSDDGRSLFGYRIGQIPADIYRIDATTGKKTFIHQLLANAPAGVIYIAPLVVNGDGSEFVYTYYQVSSTLYLISGLR